MSSAGPGGSAPASPARTLLVVGARGLGRELALHFAARGWNVVCASRTRGDVEALSAEVAERGGAGLGCVADLGSPPSLAALCDAAWGRFGRVDLCVSAQTSGLPFAPRPLAGLPPDFLARALAAYPQAALHLLQAVAPRMAAAGGGTWVQIGTGSGLRPRAGFGLQGTAQAALHALLSVAAQELKPSGVHTVYLAVAGQLESERARGYVERHGLSATLPPAAIAEAIEYLHGQPQRAWTHELLLRPAAAAER